MMFLNMLAHRQQQAMGGWQPTMPNSWRCEIITMANVFVNHDWHLKPCRHWERATSPVHHWLRLVNRLFLLDSSAFTVVLKARIKMLLRQMSKVPLSLQEPLSFLVAHVTFLVGLDQSFHQILHSLRSLHAAGVPVFTGQNVQQPEPWLRSVHWPQGDC